ncbi:MAG: iron-containing alcohol dehydrogenase [Synergistaceae bacterium]|jgi:alcohol dehydrogenase|nr:iron-containing alcohol dehydrogenase [Synergistaceae bacterium]
MIMVFDWGVTNAIHFGNGVLKDLPEIIKAYHAKDVLFITDPGLMKIGYGERAMQMLEHAGLRCYAFTEVQPDPTDTVIDEILRRTEGRKFDVIVALGGGSSIDTAKAVNIMLHNPRPITQYDGFNTVPNHGMPLICIPTTAGTGSESTPVCVIKDTAKKKKMVILGMNVGATHAIIDPELTYGLPSRITAATGMDALAHCMESYIATNTNVISRQNSIKGMNLIYNNLLTCYRDPKNAEARYNQMLGSTFAALSFGSTNLGLCHAIAMPLGAFYGISHGDGNAVCLPETMAYNAKVVAGQFVEMGAAMGMGEAKDLTADKVIENLYKLAADLEIPKLAAYGIGKDKFTDELIDAILMEGALTTNPKQPTSEDLMVILNSL